MLAPLKDRSILDREEDTPPENASSREECLRQALREARRQLKHSAKEAASEIVALQNQLARLSAEREQLARELAEFRSGQAVIALGQRLMSLQQQNDQLGDALKEIWFLERTLAAAHRECERLARERDRLHATLPEALQHRHRDL